MRERLQARGPMKGTSDGARARQNAVARDLLIAQTIAREARELRLPTLAVDRPLEGMVEAAAAKLAPAVERLPRGGDLAAARAFEAEARATQIRLYEEWLASGEAGGSR